jgi:hypothetical protein
MGFVAIQEKRVVAQTIAVDRIRSVPMAFALYQVNPFVVMSIANQISTVHQKPHLNPHVSLALLE